MRVSLGTSDFPKHIEAGAPSYNPRLDRKIALPGLGPLPPHLGVVSRSLEI